MFHFSFLNYSECTLYIPIGTTEAYKASADFKDFINICETDFHTGINSMEDERGKREDTEMDIKPTRVYRLDGKSSQLARKGVQILQHNDGKTVKIIR